MNSLAEMPLVKSLPSVAFLTDSFPVISQTFVMEMADSLTMAGVPLQILTIGTDGADRTLLSAYANGDDLAARTVRPTTGANEIGRFLGDQTLNRRMRFNLFARAAIRPHRARRLLGRAAAFARTPEADILHCQFATLGDAALRYRETGLLRFSRLVVHLRGWDISMYTKQNGPEALRRVFAEGDLFIANCQHFADRAIELGCDASRIQVIGSPIDTDRFAPPVSRAFPSKVLRIGAVGRLVEKKGFGDLIDATAKLRDRGVSATLDIIGDGPLRKDLEQLIERHDLAETVTLRGAAPSDGVLDLLHRIDLFVAPSVQAASGDEDAPVNTLKEAMATELPVIGTRHGGIPELVKDGVNGLLVPERDPDALCDALQRLSETSADSRAEMGRTGRRKVISEYGRSVIAARTIDAYVQALSTEIRR